MVTLFISNSIEETHTIGQGIAQKCSGGEVFCLYGDLGAGKTTFVHGFIHFFIPHIRVLSPTFIIVRHYQVTNNAFKYLYHLDLYRIESIADIEQLGVLENFHQPDKIFFIEWAEKLKSLLPKIRIEIKIEQISDSKRKITIERYG